MEKSKTFSMRILPLNNRLQKYLRKHNLERQFTKQLKLFKANPFYPSLHTEILEPKNHRIYSFRITKRYRALFIYRGNETIEIFEINDHYQ